MSERILTPTAQAGSVVDQSANGTPAAMGVVTPHLVPLTTEDDTPVDNLPSEKHQRLLTEPLYSSWPGPGQGRPFLAAANVGLFWIPRDPAIVPDVLLSLEVTTPQDWWTTRSYLLWEFGKVPEVVIEIVSNTIGEEQGTKRTTYAQIGIPYYIIYDPQQYLRGEVLAVYELQAGHYIRRPDTWLPTVGLGVRLWDGTFEGRHDTWLRWCDQQGVVIPTGAERAEHERQRAERERQRAEYERQQAERERQQAERERQQAERERQRAEHEHQRAEHEHQQAALFAAKLRELGIDPDRL
jgi:Uma2 family endonuclease